MDRLQELNQKLRQGLHVDNLDAMVELCKGLSSSSDSPLPYYVLTSVFADLSSFWTRRPLPTEKYEMVTSVLVPLLQEVMGTLVHQRSPLELNEALDKLVKRFIQLQVTRDVFV